MIAQQLHMWMGWHLNKTSHKGHKVQSTTKAARTLNDLLQSRGGRKLTEAEMYSRLYFLQCVRPLVTETNLKCNPQTRGEKLAIICKCTKIAWENKNDAAIIAKVKCKLEQRATGNGEKEVEELTEEEILEWVAAFCDRCSCTYYFQGAGESTSHVYCDFYWTVTHLWLVILRDNGGSWFFTRRWNQHIFVSNPCETSILLTIVVIDGTLGQLHWVITFCSILKIL